VTKQPSTEYKLTGLSFLKIEDVDIAGSKGISLLQSNLCHSLYSFPEPSGPLYVQWVTAYLLESSRAHREEVQDRIYVLLETVLESVKNGFPVDLFYNMDFIKLRAIML
jgi:hypothetical protein